MKMFLLNANWQHPDFAIVAKFFTGVHEWYVDDGMLEEIKDEIKKEGKTPDIIIARIAREIYELVKNKTLRKKDVEGLINSLRFNIICNAQNKEINEQ